ncbi:MAG: response regulator transcription factor [Spirochaetales bacterium]|nr:response regulator transcription factor [Spirochaetales bacterium]
MPQAEQEGYLRLFLNEGSKAARLLYKALSAGIARAYTGRVLTAFPVPAGGSSCDDQGKGLVEPLSRREKEVLRQIAAGSSNKEAAMALYISEGTIKNHLKNIFGKLDVGNRTQAVGRARNLGLLD